MHNDLSISGTVEGKTISLSWNRPDTVQSFKLRIDKCPNHDCYTVLTQKTEETALVLTDAIYSQCTIYNIRLEGIGAHQSTVSRDEIMLKKSFSECYISADIIIAVGFCLLALLLLGGLLICYYFHRKHPIHKLTRVRSRLYSRLYSQERYQLPIRRADLAELVKRELDTIQPFCQEFERLERMSFDTIQRKTTVAELSSNRKRNRYNDIVPFDSTRVRILPPYKISGDIEASDYINASFISDVLHSADKKYIAAQGPGEDTTPAFWQMIWQYDIRVVVMLTAVLESCGIKCNTYWPDELGEMRKYNDLTIQLFDIAEAPTYVIRKFDLSHASSSTSRVIVHIQYISWPDRTAPSSCEELIQLVQLTRVMYNQYSNKGCDTPSPILIHCSAGVGRTGTYICVDQVMKVIDKQTAADIDVFHTVYQLRRDRRYMVQTRAQYEYVYRCIVTYLQQRDKLENQNIV